MRDWHRSVDWTWIAWNLITLIYMQMLGTMTPVFIFPDEVFTLIPFVPTLEGQYIIKNLVLISAGIVVAQPYVAGNCS